ncbi:MAG: protein phosphatase 2C domain-containing protein [Lachnospiraceae bacterium]|nr:protein phosphatase 2C domain-containing protein [Lachnospiraceae bacterium]
MERVISKKTDGDLFSWVKQDDQTLIAFSLQGRSHKKDNIPLQDNHAIRILPNGWKLLVVCDGVGSKPHSDEGAEIAANAFADFIAKFFGSYLDDNSVLNLLKCAAHYATGEMCQRASLKNNNIHNYNTTLHAVIFANGIVYYFHSGDGGIIALTEEGVFKRLTEPQKDEQYVVPLLAGPEQWEVGKADFCAQSVLLCTDGVYDKLAGSILKKYGEEIDKGICTFFLNPWCFDSWDNPKMIAEKMSLVFTDRAQPNDFYQIVAKGIAQGKAEGENEASIFVRDWIYNENYPLAALQGIQDDITVAIVQNTAERPACRPMEEFKGPDWETISREVYRKLYGIKEKTKKEILKIV